LLTVEISRSVSGAGFEGAGNASVGAGLVPALVRAPTRDAPTMAGGDVDAGVIGVGRSVPDT
jgi:hypothetical protein